MVIHVGMADILARLQFEMWSSEDLILYRATF